MNKNFVAIVMMFVVVAFGVVGIEGATIIRKFEDLVPDEPGRLEGYMYMDLGSNLMKIDSVTGLPVVVPKVGVWHLGIYKEVEDWIVIGGGASTDNNYSNNYPGYEGGLLAIFMMFFRMGSLRMGFFLLLFRRAWSILLWSILTGWWCLSRGLSCMGRRTF